METDIGVLAAIPVELGSALKIFEIEDQNPHRSRAGSVYWRFRQSSEPSSREYQCVLGCIGRSGNYVSAVAATEMIATFRPRFIILFGIAAGRRRKVKIGEVVLSEQVVAYEAAALHKAVDGSQLLLPRYDIPRIDHWTEQSLSYYQTTEPVARVGLIFRSADGRFPDPPLGQEQKYARDVTTVVKIHREAIASGEKLLRDPEKLRVMAEQVHDKIVAAEMEAAGFVEACRYFGVGWFVVRGISDFGDRFKSDKFQRLAALLAAATTRDFMSRALEVGGRRTTSRGTRVAAEPPLPSVYELNDRLAALPTAIPVGAKATAATSRSRKAKTGCSSLELTAYRAVRPAFVSPQHIVERLADRPPFAGEPGVVFALSPDDAVAEVVSQARMFPPGLLIAIYRLTLHRVLDRTGPEFRLASKRGTTKEMEAAWRRDAERDACEALLIPSPHTERSLVRLLRADPGSSVSFLGVLPPNSLALVAARLGVTVGID